MIPKTTVVWLHSIGANATYQFGAILASRLCPVQQTELTLHCREFGISSDVIQYIPIVLGTIFSVLSVLHVYWALGGTAGFRKSIPVRENGEPLFNPGKGITLLVAGGLATMATYFLAGQWMHTFQGYWSIPGWIIAGLFLIRAIGDFKYIGFLKRIGGSDFARMDTVLYSPLCLFISGLIVLYFLEGIVH
ncbi:MAG: DUF3995 domain-containing protein [Leptospiraceae bacterium]